MKKNEILETENQNFKIKTKKNSKLNNIRKLMTVWKKKKFFQNMTEKRFFLKRMKNEKKF